MKKWKKITAIAVAGGIIVMSSTSGASQISAFAASKTPAVNSMQNMQYMQNMQNMWNMQNMQGMQFSQNSFGMTGGMQYSQNNFGMTGGMQPGQNNFGMAGGMQQTNDSNVTLSSSPSDIVTASTTNSAADLTVDEANATTITMSSDNNDVTIENAGTYIITGKCSDGNITVKKGTTGVVLILKNLTLKSTTGATLSVNKESEVKIVVKGTVKLTDAEDPSDEESEDADVADAFDGAVIKVKDGASCYLTGTGKLTLNGSSCKNGIKTGDDENTSLVIDGSLKITIKAANDGINAGYDLAILSGTVNISAGDDGIHADRILTIGEDGNGPTIKISKSNEGLEGTIVNLFGGKVTVVSTDDGINAANKNNTYSALTYAINITGGTHMIKTGGDGLDSNGDINITGGTVTISSASNGGEAGIDYDGNCYISDDATLNNNSGIAGPDGGGMQQMTTCMPRF
ncbi:MAG: carbohydrate-binding domain-containing protein [Lachnospiraceae bacterium]|nr:carbohydrate-binding domain-containing protein [Lachnospiraceae bacterium]